jgi:hypothetical protein
MEYTETEIEGAYDSYGITVKTWFTEKATTSYYVWVFEFGGEPVFLCRWSNPRTIEKRDGLISFQVTVHSHRCWTCEHRVRFIQQQIAAQNLQCFWSREPGGSLYVTVRPPPPRMSKRSCGYGQSTRAEFRATQSFLLALGLFVSPYRRSPKQSHSKRQRTKAHRPKRRHTVQ